MKQLLIALLISAAVSSAAIDPALMKARDAQDRPAIDKFVADAKAAADKSPKDAEAQYRYALAVSIQAEVALEMKDKAGASRASSNGIPAAQAAIALKPDRSDYYSVLGTLYGQGIPGNIFSAIGSGKRAQDAIAKAKQLDPKSAQAWIAEGVGFYYEPATFGGGPDPAIRSLKRALELDPKSAEAWLWLGLAQRRKQENAEARESFTKSLAIDPNRVWAKEQLAKTPAK